MCLESICKIEIFVKNKIRLSRSLDIVLPEVLLYVNEILLS